MSQMKTSRLGRGLSALLGDVDPSVSRLQPAANEGSTGEPTLRAVQPATAGSATDNVRLMPIEHLRRNPDQPRKRFDDKDLEDLTNSVREKGLIQPILVRPIPGVPDAYQIVAGERRWRASQRAELKEVPVVIRDLNDQEVLEISIIENVQRADLNAIEEARGYKALMEQFGHTQEDIAKVIGKSRSHVANTMRLLALPPRVRDMVYEGKLSAGHARAIATAPDPETLADRFIAEGLPVREAEALARASHEEAGSDPTARGGRPSGKDPNVQALEAEVAQALGLEVDIKSKGEAGEIRIRYTQLEQLEDVCRRLKAAAVQQQPAQQSYDPAPGFVAAPDQGFQPQPAQEFSAQPQQDPSQQGGGGGFFGFGRG
jgi:ParB family chromosome partitioning protein